MVTIKKEGIILKETELEFENEGVLNPAILQEGNTVHIFYCAVRKGNFSTIGYAKLDGPLKVVERKKEPLLVPNTDDEIHGIEDPRIVKIDDLYYLTYCAYDGVNALGSIATSNNLVDFERHGIIVPQISYEGFKRLAECSGHLNEKYERFHVHNNVLNNPNKKMLLWDKNVIFFPKTIDGKFTFLHRIRPDIQIVKVNSIVDLTTEFWNNYFLHFNEHILMTPKYNTKLGILEVDAHLLKPKLAGY